MNTEYSVKRKLALIRELKTDEIDQTLPWVCSEAGFGAGTFRTHSRKLEQGMWLGVIEDQNVVGGCFLKFNSTDRHLEVLAIRVGSARPAASAFEQIFGSLFAIGAELACSAIVFHPRGNRTWDFLEAKQDSRPETIGEEEDVSPDKAVAGFGFHGQL